MNATGPRRGGAWSIFLFLTGVYLLSSSFCIDNIDSWVRLEVARSIARRGELDIPRLEIPTEYGVIGSFVGRNGRFYSVYGIGQSLLMVPFVWLGGKRDAQLATLINVFAVALTCAVVFLIGVRLRFSPSASRRVALLTGFATLAWPHSKLVFEAPLEMLCLTTSLWLLLSEKRKDAAIAGATVGFALLCRSTAVAMIPGLVWLLLRVPGIRVQRLICFIVGLAPLAALALAYNWYRWGSPFASGYLFTGHQYFTSRPEGILGLLVSPGRGFFWFSPILILSLFGWPDFRERSKIREVGIVLSLSYVALFGFSTVWHGDWTWGPRHLLPIVPVIALGLLPLAEPGRLKWPVWVPVVSISVFVQLVGVSVYYHPTMERILRTNPAPAYAAGHHFRLASSQLALQTQAMVSTWERLPTTLSKFHVGVDESPYADSLHDETRPIHLRTPPVVRQLPSFWWLYLPLTRAAWSSWLLLLCLCFVPIGVGFAGLYAGAQREVP